MPMSGARCVRAGHARNAIRAARACSRIRHLAPACPPLPFPPQLLRTAGIECSIYDVAAGRLLLTLQQGWRGFEAREFLLAQAAVRVVEWDQQSYFKASGEGASDRGASAARRGRKKSRARKARRG